MCGTIAQPLLLVVDLDFSFVMVSSLLDQSLQAHTLVPHAIGKVAR